MMCVEESYKNHHEPLILLYVARTSCMQHVHNQIYIIANIAGSSKVYIQYTLKDCLTNFETSRLGFE